MNNVRKLVVSILQRKRRTYSVLNLCRRIIESLAWRVILLTCTHIIFSHALGIEYPEYIMNMKNRIEAQHH